MAPSLSFQTIDLAVVAAANLYNLLITAIFLTRPSGWKRFEKVTGLVMVALALPLAAAVVLNLVVNRTWWFIVLPIPLIGPYLGLFYVGQWGLIGYAFLVAPVYGFVTLATYFLCLGATRYAHAKGVG
jgi:hypothetical protein